MITMMTTQQTTSVDPPIGRTPSVTSTAAMVPAIAIAIAIADDGSTFPRIATTTATATNRPEGMMVPSEQPAPPTSTPALLSSEYHMDATVLAHQLRKRRHAYAEHFTFRTSGMAGRRCEPVMAVGSPGPHDTPAATITASINATPTTTTTPTTYTLTTPITPITSSTTTTEAARTRTCIIRDSSCSSRAYYRHHPKNHPDHPDDHHRTTTSTSTSTTITTNNTENFLVKRRKTAHPLTNGPAQAVNANGACPSIGGSCGGDDDDDDDDRYAPCDDDDHLCVKVGLLVAPLGLSGCSFCFDRFPQLRSPNPRSRITQRKTYLITTTTTTHHHHRH